MPIRALLFCTIFVLINGCTSTDDDNPAPNTNPQGKPLISALADQNIRIGSQTPISLTVSATDPNGLDLTYELSTTSTVIDPIALNNALDPVTHEFNWDVSQENAGSYDLTFTVTNSNGESASTTLTVTIMVSFDYGGWLYANQCETCHGNANNNWIGTYGTIICVSTTAFDAAFQTNGKMDGILNPPPDQQGLGDIYNYVTSVTNTCA